ncbi:hypothetical protein [Pedobacter nyackensis]|nr:hypothetical protein [Pedobacter nyackensis]
MSGEYMKNQQAVNINYRNSASVTRAEIRKQLTSGLRGPDYYFPGV